LCGWSNAKDLDGCAEKAVKWLEVSTIPAHCSKSRSLEFAKKVCEISACYDHYYSHDTWCGFFRKCQSLCMEKAEDLRNELNEYEQSFSLHLNDRWNSIVFKSCFSNCDLKGDLCTLRECINGETGLLFSVPKCKK